MNYYQYQTVLGLLTICEENDAVIAINVGHYSENKGCLLYTSDAADE